MNFNTNVKNFLINFIFKNKKTQIQNKKEKYKELLRENILNRKSNNYLKLIYNAQNKEKLTENYYKENQYSINKIFKRKKSNSIDLSLKNIKKADNCDIIDINGEILSLSSHSTNNFVLPISLLNKIKYIDDKSIIIDQLNILYKEFINNINNIKKFSFLKNKSFENLNNNNKINRIFKISFEEYLYKKFVDGQIFNKNIYIPFYLKKDYSPFKKISINLINRLKYIDIIEIKLKNNDLYNLLKINNNNNDNYILSKKKKNLANNKIFNRQNLIKSFIGHYKSNITKTTIFNSKKNLKNFLKKNNNTKKLISYNYSISKKKPIIKKKYSSSNLKNIKISKPIKPFLKLQSSTFNINNINKELKNYKFKGFKISKKKIKTKKKFKPYIINL